MPGPSIADIFDSTSPEFDLVTPLVWGPAGETLVARAQVSLGDRVLDICSGTGASALAAARVVGPDGHVTAVDFAADLIDRGRTSAYAAGLRNIDFRVGDVTALSGHDQGEYDVLTCGFGVFFLPDMDNSVRNLLPLLRPGGRRLARRRPLRLHQRVLRRGRPRDEHPATTGPACSVRRTASPHHPHRYGRQDRRLARNAWRGGCVGVDPRSTCTADR